MEIFNKPNFKMWRTEEERKNALAAELVLEESADLMDVDDDITEM